MNYATLCTGDTMKIQHTQYLDTVESTNTYLKMLTTNKKPNGFLIYTFNQTKGRGRRASTWHSQKDEDIALSMYHQTMQAPFRELMRTAVSVVDTLRSFNIKATIKLPNDIYVNNQKLAGILIENILAANAPSTIIGVGINANSTRVDKANEISIKDVLHSKINKKDFINQFICIYNQVDDTVLYHTFKSYINFNQHVCDYAGNRYALRDINETCICMLEKNNKTINIPCQHVSFNLKNS